MKVVLCLVLVAFATIVVQAHMPKDMPDDLKKEAEELREEIHKWKSENKEAKWRDMPEALRKKMDDLKEKYEKETGHEWPRHKGHGRLGGKRHHNETTATT